MALTLLCCFSSVLRAPLIINFPISRKEAMTMLEVDKWKVAEDTELSKLRRLQVAHLIPLPVGARLLLSKWVYEIKWSRRSIAP